MVSKVAITAIAVLAVDPSFVIFLMTALSHLYINKK